MLIAECLSVGDSFSVDAVIHSLFVHILEGQREKTKNTPALCFRLMATSKACSRVPP